MHDYVLYHLEKLIYLDVATAILLVSSGPLWAQETDLEAADESGAVAGQARQDDVSKALDSTATQWSFQFA